MMTFMRINLRAAIRINLPAAIRYRRAAAGLTQEELGSILGVGRSRVCQLETDGYQWPTIRSVLAIAHALGVSASRLVKDAERLGK
jgi:transcriptional regulator with XRE-family HTH domain